MMAIASVGGAAADGTCSLILGGSQAKGLPEVAEIRRTLEAGSEGARIEAMKAALTLLSTGEGPHRVGSALLMTIIRFVMPNQRNKLLKKLVLLFVELIPKVDSEGRLLSEMILLCNALRNDLQHPNEYVRGVTLRFLTRIQEAEILEPLLPSIRLCLEHRHPYVRRNAIVALFSIFCTNDHLVPDAPEIVKDLLTTETDSACQRHAFLMLLHCDPDRAEAYFASILDRLPVLDPPLQLALLEYIRASPTAHSRDPQNAARNLKGVVTLLQAATCSVVKFEAASTLVQLSASPAIVRAVAACYIDLVVRETDNNAKLLVLEKYRHLQAAHGALINEGILDVLRVLAASDLEVRKKALQILMAGMTARDAAELIAFLVKELAKAGEYDRAVEYKQDVLRVVDVCARHFPAVAGAALHCFISLLCSSADQKSLVLINDAIRFSKQILERAPALRTAAVDQLLSVLLERTFDPQAASGLLWIIGEFATLPGSIQAAFERFRASLGPLPIVETELQARLTANDGVDHQHEARDCTKKPSSAGGRASSGVLVRKLNPDGTYATETALTATDTLTGGCSLRQFILDSQYSVAVALGYCMTKMALHGGAEAPDKGNFQRAQAMMALTSMLRVGLSDQQHQLVRERIDRDSYDRLMLCLRVLSKGPTETPLKTAFLSECRAALDAHLKRLAATDAAVGGAAALGAAPIATAQCDDPVSFRIAKAASGSLAITIADGNGWEEDVRRATTGSEPSMSVSEATGALVSSLSRVVQLTGFSDEIYAETYVTISHTDIILDILLVNQTAATLENVTIDLNTRGELKLSEKPAPITLAPHGFAAVKAAVKVRATDNGLVFGCISYGTVETHSIVLCTLTIDICEYIRPATLPEAAFRAQWPTLEWENKINVAPVASATICDALQGITAGAHLQCITKDMGVSATGEYLAANLFARTIFGEEILANVCLERGSQGVTGHLRLRSKTQGIAVALGDRITQVVAAMAHAADS